MSEEPRITSDLPSGLGAGSRVAGYVLEELVGTGGMAVVFRAVDERLGRRVALKILAPALATDQAFRQRFLRESRAAAAVDDPHIIPVYEAGDAGGILFIAMRYVPGRDARTLLHQDGPLSVDRATAIISPVASALDAAHEAGLVHRDVKPANVLVDSRPGRPDHVYLSDFGLSKGALSSVGLTGAGNFLGTPNYTAPEQIEGKPVDGRADQYALACTAFELLSGEAPFQRDQGMAVIWAHLQQAPPALSSRCPGLPEGVDHVFARALAKAAGQRYPSCEEFADALRGALGQPPYNPAPGLVRAADHAPTQVALPLGRVAADIESDTPATPGAVLPAHQNAGRDMPATVATLPATTPVEPPVVAGPARTPAPTRRAAAASGTGPARPARHRTTVAAISTVAAAGVIASVVLVARSHQAPPPVLRPAGLVADSSTPNSAAFRWSGPATGPVPDRYAILKDGALVASIPGNVTFYDEMGLAPATSYRFQVVAIRSGRHSKRSAVLNTATLTPPVSAAVLTGTWTTRDKTVAAYPYDPNWSITVVGKKWNDTWSFSPDCPSGPCSVALAGTFWGIGFSGSLTRAGVVYTGTVTSRRFSYCGSVSNRDKDTLHIRITIHAAGTRGLAWAATSWSGRLTLYSPYNPVGNCYADTITVGIHSAG